MKAPTPRFLLFGCGHRLEVRGLEMRRAQCPTCRDRRVSADDRIRVRDEAVRKAAATRKANALAAVLADARRRDNDLPLTAWARGAR